MKKIAGASTGAYACALVLIAIFFLLAAGRAAATDFSSSNFKVKDPVLSGGAGYGTSASFKLWGNVSQIAIGSSTSAAFRVRSGFLYFPAASASPSPSPTPTPSPSPSPGGGNIPVPGGGALSPPSVSLLPPLVGFVRQIIGEPPGIQKCGRSDYNCDGKVNLKDLSIFFSFPRRVNTPNLSLVLADWTDRLVRFGREEAERVAPPEIVRSRPPRLEPPLAQVGGSFTSPPPEPSEPRGEPRVGILTRISQFLVAIVRFIGRIFGF